MKDLVIIGAGGFGREVADTIASINIECPTYNLIGFVDDDKSFWDTKVNDVKVLGGREELKKLCMKSDICAVMAIANANVKCELATYLGEVITWENIIHPMALVSKYAQMGTGNIIREFVVVASNARIGNHCMVNANSGLGHDVKIGDFSSVMTHCDVAGNAKLGVSAFMGTGARILPGVTVGDRTFICAGAVVIKDIEDNSKVLGNPARVIG